MPCTEYASPTTPRTQPGCLCSTLPTVPRTADGELDVVAVGEPLAEAEGLADAVADALADALVLPLAEVLADRDTVVLLDGVRVLVAVTDVVGE